MHLACSCAPFTEQYQDSLAAYLSGGTLANTTLGQLVKPFAGRLDDYYVAAVSGVADV